MFDSQNFQNKFNIHVQVLNSFILKEVWKKIILFLLYNFQNKK